MEKQDNLYTLIENYADINGLSNTKLALPLAKELLNDILHRTFKTENKTITSLEHCLKATKMLIDLHIMLPKEEEDLLLAAMLCHDMLKNNLLTENGQELVSIHHLDSRIPDLLRLITKTENMNEAQKESFYKGIQDHKLAVLITLADHSNLVEQLSELSISDVNEFVHEMRKYFLPMCVNAKQYHRDCHMSINIMMEKIRCLIDVTDIIANRYQKRELAYVNEILSIMEENARLRGMIHQLENGEIL